MEEEHEDNMLKVSKDKKAVRFTDSAGNWKDSSPVSADKDSNSDAGAKSSSQSPPGKGDAVKENVAPEEGVETPGAELEGNGEEKSNVQEEGGDEMDEEEEEIKPLDVRLEAIKEAAVGHSQWSVISQNVALHKLVIDAYTITEVLRLHFLSCGGYRESPDRRSNRVYRRGGFLDTDDPAMELMLNHPEICSELLLKPVFSLSAELKVAILSSLCTQLLTYATTRDFVEESYLETRKAAIQANKVRVSEVRRKKEEEKALTKWKKELKIMRKQKEETDKDKKQESSAPDEATVVREVEDTAKDASVGKEMKTGSRLEPPGTASTDVNTGSRLEGVALEAPPTTMSKEEEEAHLEKVEEEMAEYRKASYKASACVRTRPIGEDRYRRKYWLFHTLPGLFVEDCGIHQSMSEEKEPSSTVVGELSGQATEVGTGAPDVSQRTVVAESGSSTDSSSSITVAPVASAPAATLTSCVSALVVPSNTASSASTATDSSDSALITTSVSSSTAVSSPHDVANQANQPGSGEESVSSPIPVGAQPVVANVSSQKTDTSLDTPVSGASSCNPVSDTVTPPLACPATEAVPPTSCSSNDTNLAETVAPTSAGESAADSGIIWRCYSTTEEIETLLKSLNPRGLRENKLSKSLSEHLKDEHLSTSKNIFQGERTLPSLLPKYNSTEEFFELYLREQILDIEEKIHLGNLGYISNREEWRESIENSGAAAAIGKAEELQPSEGQQSEENGVTVRGRSSVKELANALLKVQGGLGKKFLMPPLGMAKDQKKKKDKVVEVKEREVCVESWRESLSKASSFSQIFLHLATLERAVMWSKSLMKVRCRICRRKCGEEFMLLCDGCDHGYHTYCLKPPLEEVPEGDWFCYDCVPVTPIKPRLRRPRVVIIEEEVEEEEEDEEEEEEDEVEDEEEDEEEMECSNVEETESDIEENDSEEMEEECERVYTRRGSRPKTPPLMRGKTRAAAKKKKRGGRKKFIPPKLGKRKHRVEEDTEEEVASPLPKKKRHAKEQEGRGKSSGKNSQGYGKKKQVAVKAQTNLDQRGKQKEVPMRSRKWLKLDSPVAGANSPANFSNSKTELIIASIIDLRTSQSGQRLTGSARRELRGLETQLCQALWDEISLHKDSWHFAAPVKKREVGVSVLYLC